jgi:hypothetical protein
MADTVQPPPPPPRLTGVPEQDLLIVAAHLNEIYQNNFINYQVTKTVTGYDPASFDPASLPDPASTTLGKAQKTANDAYALANAAKSTADQAKTDAQTAKTNAQTAIDKTKYWGFGSVTLSGTNNSQEYLFPGTTAEPIQPDASYNIVFSCDAYTGTPPFDSTQVIKCVRAADRFTVTVNNPPGAGNTVTLHWQIRR